MDPHQQCSPSPLAPRLIVAALLFNGMIVHIQIRPSKAAKRFLKCPNSLHLRNPLAAPLYWHAGPSQRQCSLVLNMSCREERSGYVPNNSLCLLADG